MKQEKQQYLSPQLTVVVFAAERGFANSDVLKMGAEQPGGRYRVGSGWSEPNSGGSIWD